MTIAAEMWDKMQHIMERYNDHMIHICARFEGGLDTSLLKRAFACAIDRVPILKSVFAWGLGEPRWKTIDSFDINDVFTYVETDGDAAALAEKYVLGIIDETKEAQIKIWQIRRGKRDTLAILLNHMCFDGADTKVFLYYVASIYNDLVKGGSGDLPIKQGSRSANQIYKNLSPKQHNEAIKLISYSKKQKSKIAYPFAGSKSEDRYPKINKFVLGEAAFLNLKSRCKEQGVSINDIVLAAFFRATEQMVDIKPEDTLGIPNMVDLRRYMPDGASLGLCNLTSMVVSNIGKDLGNDIFDTARNVKSSMDELKGYYPGLHGLPLLQKVFASVPYPLAKFLIGTFFKNPLIGVSNIGIIDNKQFVFEGAKAQDVYMTGSVKYPPYMQLALSTFGNVVTHTVAVYGTDADHEMFSKMFAYYAQELSAFTQNKDKSFSLAM